MAVPSEFPTTHWSLVQAAGQDCSPQARDALADVCHLYQGPLYAFIRRRGHDEHAACDLLQGFFCRLIETNVVAAADPDRGRFRSYLLSTLKHFLSNEHDRATAEKRGGGRVLSLDAAAAETRYILEPMDSLTPERAFDRSWALALLDRTLQLLREESDRDAHGGRFELLQPFLGEKRKDLGSYAEVAAVLHLSEGAVRQAVHRLRQRFADLLRSEIARTVSGPDEVEQEIRSLFQALGR